MRTALHTGTAAGLLFISFGMASAQSDSARFDFTDVRPSPSGSGAQQYMRGGYGPAPAVATADNPGGSISLQEAIEKKARSEARAQEKPQAKYW